MVQTELLGTGDRDRWMAVLEQVYRYDFYHLPGYHAIAEAGNEGIAQFFVYTEGDYTLAFPILLRPVNTVPGLEEAGEGYYDTSSVYGYPGPVSSHASVPAPIIANFHTHLRQVIQERGVIAAFSRLHPFIAQEELLTGLGEYIPLGETVYIDLTLTPEEQWAHYRSNHKRDVNKLIRQGTTCVHDTNFAYLDAFQEIYYQTMQRVDATTLYFFDTAYFRRLINELSPNIHLFVCLNDNVVACGGLFTLFGGIVQYHLGGTRDEFLTLAPTKLLFEMVRLWANEQSGAKVFHLGGGVGSKQDSLFHFKAGFSDCRQPFAIWRLVINTAAYARLCAMKDAWNAQHNLYGTPENFFPGYRRQTRPLEHPSQRVSQDEHPRGHLTHNL